MTSRSRPPRVTPVASGLGTWIPLLEDFPDRCGIQDEPWAAIGHHPHVQNSRGTGCPCGRRRILGPRWPNHPPLTTRRRGAPPDDPARPPLRAAIEPALTSGLEEQRRPLAAASARRLGQPHGGE